MDWTSPTNSGKRLPTSIVFSEVKSQPICQCRRRLGLAGRQFQDCKGAWSTIPKSFLMRADEVIE